MKENIWFHSSIGPEQNITASVSHRPETMITPNLGDWSPRSRHGISHVQRGCLLGHRRCLLAMSSCGERGRDFSSVRTWTPSMVPHPQDCSTSQSSHGEGEFQHRNQGSMNIKSQPYTFLTVKSWGWRNSYYFLAEFMTLSGPHIT